MGINYVTCFEGHGYFLDELACIYTYILSVIWFKIKVFNIISTSCN